LLVGDVFHMRIIVVGLNHRTAPVEVRERLSFTRDRIEPAYEALHGGPVRECVILSTCNRTEIYAVVEKYHAGLEAVKSFLSSFHGVERAAFEDHLYVLSGSEAVTHLGRVACGLDAMILGETQILGQVKDAYMAAVDCGAVGKVLHNLFEHSLRVGKRAHSETGISQNAVSVSYAAVELARKVFSSLQGRKAMIIGAGEMSELTAQHLVQAGVGEVIVANRTWERASELAARFDGRAVPFSEIVDWLSRVDIVISSTGAPHVIIKYDAMREALRARRFRPIFLIDIAVPRDIDPEVQSLDGVYLYDIDDLKSVVAANLRERQREAEKVEEIIREETGVFEAWLNSLEVVPIIRSLRQKAEDIRKREVQRAFNKLPDLTERERKVIEAMTSLIVNKLLNDPLLKIKEFANGSQGRLYIETVSELFNLGEREDESDVAKVEGGG